MKSVQQLGLVLVLAPFLAALGCSSSGGTLSATQDSCTAYCNAYVVAVCDPPLYTEASACESVECVPLKGGSPSCQAAFKAYYDCKQSQADLCADTGCTREFDAINSCS